MEYWIFCYVKSSLIITGELRGLCMKYSYRGQKGPYS